jgi:hypothetical protein
MKIHLNNNQKSQQHAHENAKAANSNEYKKDEKN